MKKIGFTLLIVFVLSFLSAFAQGFKGIPLNADLDAAFKANLKIDSKGQPYVFNIKSFSGLNLTKANPIMLTGTVRDTLDETVTRTTAPWCYFYTDPYDGHDYPVTGSNSIYAYVGQTFKFTGQAKLKGVLIPFSMKIVNQTSDMFRVIACNANEQTGVPEGNMCHIDHSIDVIDTLIDHPSYNYIPLPGNPDIPPVFIIFHQTRSYQQNDDGIVIWSNTQGDGHLYNNSCLIAVDNQGQTVFAKISDLAITINNQALDIDLLIVPVIDIVSGVNDNFTIDDLTFKGLSPNPATDNIDFDLEVKTPGNTEILITSANGEIVKQLKNEYMNSGEYHYNYDIGDLASGQYFLVVRSRNTKFAVNLQVVR